MPPELHQASTLSGDNITFIVVICVFLTATILISLLVYSAGAADRRKQDNFKHLDWENVLKQEQIRAAAQVQVATIESDSAVIRAKLEAGQTGN